MEKIRILIADDEIIVAEDIKSQLQYLGYEIVAIADSGEAVIQMARELKPDLIIMDILLAGKMNGIEAADIIRRELNIPVVYLTAFAEKEIVDLAKKTGPYAFLTKPIRFQELQRAIEFAIYKFGIENQLRESEARLKTILDTIHSGVIIFHSKTSTIIDANPRALQILGYTKEQLIGKKCATIFGTTRDGICPVCETIQNMHSKEMYVLSASGKAIPVINSTTSITLKNESYLVDSFTDISAQKNSEKELIESEERFKKIAASAYDAIILMDNDGNVTFWNDAAEEIFGYSAEEALNKNLPRLLAFPKDIEKHLNGFEELNFTGQGGAIGKTIQWDAIKKGGQAIAVELSLSTFKTNERWNVVAIARDITERKMAEQEQRRLLTALEQSAELIVIADILGNIQYVNPAFENVTGYKKAEVIGKNPRLLKSGKHHIAFYENLWKTISQGNIWKGRFINKKKDGTLYDEQATISPVRDTNGRIVNYIALKRDISNEIKLEEQLRQSQKLQTIGTLAGGIAHDFNNILAPLFGYTEMLLQDVAKDSRMYKDLQQIFKAAQRAKDLVHQILTFSRQTESEPKPFLIHLIVKEALKLLSASIPATIRIKKDIHSNCGMILADPTQIHQVIMNLCTNAAYAMREQGGTLEVKLDRVELDEQIIQGFENLKKGDYIRLQVSDTGIGMDKKTMERIFEPFFTTKPVGEGTGLGLSVAHGIIKNHGGEITVESEPGKGSRFQVFLPLIQSDAFQHLAKEQQSFKGNQEHILVIDDEVELVQMLKTMLERLNYRISAKTNSLEALALFQDNPYNFDLIISDFTMPDMTGTQLAKELLSLRPDIPIILTTGSRNVINSEKAEQLGIKDFILKPFSQTEISLTLRQVLNNLQIGKKNNGSYFSC